MRLDPYYCKFPEDRECPYSNDFPCSECPFMAFAIIANTIHRGEEQ